MGYSTGVLTGVQVSVPTVASMPVVVDDMSLAHQLGINNWAMWNLILQAGKPAGSKGSCYSVLALKKRGKAGKRGKIRRTYVPSPRIRDVQKAILARFVDHIPVGDHACAYEPGRSTVDTARLCAGKSVVAQLDLKGFFPTIKRSWVRELFMEYGYTRYVAGLLASLLCVSESFYDGEGNKKSRNFLPQGSVSAPLVSNRVADLRFDQKILQELAGSGWGYLRYSDNVYLTHSQVLAREAVDQTVSSVRKKIHNAGWRTHKVRVDLTWRRQKVLGLVVNQRANLPREEYYALKAALYNCSRKGFQSQLPAAREHSTKELPTVDNLIAHLRGRLSYAKQVLAPSRVAKLQGYWDAAMRLHEESAKASSAAVFREVPPGLQAVIDGLKSGQTT